MCAAGLASLMAKSVEELKQLREQLLQTLASNKLSPQELALFHRALQRIQEQLGPAEQPN